MRTVKFLVLAILVVMVLTGCGGDRDVEIHVEVSGRATETTAAAPTPLVGLPSSTAAPGEPTAVSTEAAQPTSPPEQASAVAEVPPTEPPAATEVPPTEAPSEPTAPPPPPPTETPPVPEETYTFDPATWEASVTTLSSFRQKMTLDFTADGTGVRSKATYAGEVTTNPMALHSTLTVEGQAAAELPSNQVEVIWIGEQAWVKIGKRPWVSVPVTALESEYAGQVVGIGDLLPYIPQAHRVMPNETINGIVCKHYVYDTNDLEIESGMTGANGDIWVAQDGGYVVRLTMNGHGSYYGTYSASGTLSLVYDLYDVNAPINITPPR